MDNIKQKYLKYKKKYLELRQISGGSGSQSQSWSRYIGHPAANQGSRRRNIRHQQPVANPHHTVYWDNLKHYRSIISSTPIEVEIDNTELLTLIVNSFGEQRNNFHLYLHSLIPGSEVNIHDRLDPASFAKAQSAIEYNFLNSLMVEEGSILDHSQQSNLARNLFKISLEATAEIIKNLGIVDDTKQRMLFNIFREIAYNATRPNELYFGAFIRENGYSIQCNKYSTKYYTPPLEVITTGYNNIELESLSAKIAPIGCIPDTGIAVHLSATDNIFLKMDPVAICKVELKTKRIRDGVFFNIKDYDKILANADILRVYDLESGRFYDVDLSNRHIRGGLPVRINQTRNRVTLDFFSGHPAIHIHSPRTPETQLAFDFKSKARNHQAERNARQERRKSREIRHRPSQRLRLITNTRPRFIFMKTILDIFLNKLKDHLIKEEEVDETIVEEVNDLNITRNPYLRLIHRDVFVDHICDSFLMYIN